jgi:hypothetical protein
MDELIRNEGRLHDGRAGSLGELIDATVRPDDEVPTTGPDPHGATGTPGGGGGGTPG